MPTKPPTTIANQLSALSAQLLAAGVKSARLDTLILLESVTAKDRAWLLAHPETKVTTAQLKRLETLAERRLKREPLAYILGRAEFYGLTLEVNPYVLIPRPETETLVGLILKHAPAKARVLEVGTGSGAIAIALKHERPDLEITATDLSTEALEVARRNAAQYSIRDITFQEADLMCDISGEFDAVVANLPYVPANRQLEPELAYEPAGALFSGKDGLDHYRRLLMELPSHLQPQAIVVLEAEPAQHSALTALATERGLIRAQSEGFALLFESV